MADDVEQQVVAEILGAPLNTFSIQLDESTDVSSCAQLLVFARYIKDGDFKEEFLFCQRLETSTKGEDIFHNGPNCINYVPLLASSPISKFSHKNTTCL